MSAAKKTKPVQHTPGPWKFEKREGGATHEITFGESKMRPGCLVGWVSKFQMNAETNGALIAAAPDLYDGHLEVYRLVGEIAALMRVGKDLDADAVWSICRRIEDTSAASVAKARGQS